MDDGKSTLIGRMLYESRRVFDDHLHTLERDSRQFGTQGERLDFALLIDGLQAEREQGITIDVAYRYFATDRRRFIVADTPGHEQYTRNMATGASTADLALLLVDARNGVLTQTRRHTRILALMGIAHVVLAVNKMDLVDFSRATYDGIAREYAAFAAGCGITTVRPIPISALDGDNLVVPSGRTPWYDGPTVLGYLETVEVVRPPSAASFRLPVQWVNRPTPDFRGFCGRIATGAARPGDRVRIVPSGAESRIARIMIGDRDLERAGSGDSITITLEDHVDIARGDVIASAANPPAVADQFEARLLWMSASDLIPGRPYVLKLHGAETTASVTAIKYQVDVNTGAHIAAKTLRVNEIGVVNVATSRPLPFEPYETSHALGGFILIDKLTLETAGAGMILFALRRASNLHWQALAVNRQARAEALQQTPRCVWFTGLSGSGKSSIANMLEKKLHAAGRHTYLLDGDNVRHGLNRDLGFTEADRAENIRRVAEVAKLMVDAGLIVLVAFISPFRAERRFARELFEPGEFVEVFVDTPLEVCEQRDPKGLYAQARSGVLPNFTGIDSRYEPPESPEIRLATTDLSLERCVESVFQALI